MVDRSPRVLGRVLGPACRSRRHQRCRSHRPNQPCSSRHGPGGRDVCRTDRSLCRPGCGHVPDLFESGCLWTGCAQGTNGRGLRTDLRAHGDTHPAGLITKPHRGRGSACRPLDSIPWLHARAVELPTSMSRASAWPAVGRWRPRRRVVRRARSSSWCSRTSPARPGWGHRSFLTRYTIRVHFHHGAEHQGSRDRATGP